jgi:hypothetical protein
VEALVRAVPEPAARNGVRRLQPNRATRRHRLHPRRHHAARLRPDQPPHGETKDGRELQRQGDPQRGPVADLLLEPAGQPVRFQLLDQFLGSSVEPLLPRPPHGPGSRAWPPTPRCRRAPGCA